MTWPELRQEPRPQPSLTQRPYLWLQGNWLFLSPEDLTESLRSLARGLPAVIRPPQGRPLSLEALGVDLPGEAGLEEALYAQVASCPGLGQDPTPPELWVQLLGPRGLLNVSPEEGAALLGLPPASFLRNLEALQAWADPPGLFARDLQECLLLQLRRLGRDLSDEATLLREGREDLEGGTLKRFCQVQGWDPGRLEAALVALRRLDPAPGRGLVPTRTVRPELSLLPGSDGSVDCRLLREHQPRVEWASDLPAGETGRRLRELLLHLGLRSRTLVRLGLALAHRQRAFLLDSEAPRAPLGLRTLSDDTGISPSTLSRCLNQTWARTLRGTLPLASLLARSPRRRPDLDYDTLEALLRDAQEKGLPDRRVAETLGLPRRTVTYHRLRLGLVPSDRAGTARPGARGPHES